MTVCDEKGSLVVTNPHKITPQLCSFPQLYGTFFSFDANVNR